MSENPKERDKGRDYSQTLFLPETDFAMRAGLPDKEPLLVERWQKMGLYRRLREASVGRPKYVLHDGPPYANGHLHIGHAMNKILKDVITRSFQMRGYDSNYVPGWDCHGLPIEWKVEEDYRSRGKSKDDVPINEFRRQCREFAEHWVKVQTEEFLRLGIEGNFDSPYLTMAYEAESIIAGELMKFARSGQLYRGSKPVMWSVVERTALAEAEIEYREHESDTIWVKFPVTASENSDLLSSYILIWTTTPWTIPCNRAICFSDRIDYGLYEIVSSEHDYGPQSGEMFLVADSLVEECSAKAKVEVRRVRSVTSDELSKTESAHPFCGVLDGYDFVVPLLCGSHVTDDAGTGFVHTAPSHGRDDFEIWTSHASELDARGITSSIPFTVDDAGYYMSGAPGFEGVRVIDDKGRKGDANSKVIETLISGDCLFSRGRLKHDYPHSWRSKKPVIFRNTPQWFVSMDKALSGGTLRELSLSAIDSTRFVPPTGQSRLRLMIEDRPDWVLSRQRVWGVPLTIFRHKETHQIAPGPDIEWSDSLASKIESIFCEEGADAWYAEDAKARFLGEFVDSLDDWEKVDDILDVWFDSGSTHAFCLERRADLKWPADLYLEGSDQHRGWFHSSLLESCGTRGRAPYDAVLTHGFFMAEDGRKMSKSGGNNVTPDDITKKSGADILRLWVVSSDYTEDVRIGPEILKTAIDAYRKLRNSLRWMLGTLSHYEGEEIAYSDLPELERLMLHRVYELNDLVQRGYDDFNFKRVFSHLLHFANIDLSAFYFDIQKDCLYCDAPSSLRRRASLYVVSQLFDCLTAWLSPMLCFTMEEAWLSRHPDSDSVHLRQFPDIPSEWRDDELSAKWDKVRSVRRVVTGALEVERREKRIGSSLESRPVVHITDDALRASLSGLDFAEICITSGIEIVDSPPPSSSFTLSDVSGVSVVHRAAEGKKCARSWKILPDVGSDSDYPDLSSRDALVMRELDSLTTKP